MPPFIFPYSIRAIRAVKDRPYTRKSLFPS
jgi:hypothetical protein